MCWYDSYLERDNGRGASAGPPPRLARTCAHGRGVVAPAGWSSYGLFGDRQTCLCGRSRSRGRADRHRTDVRIVYGLVRARTHRRRARNNASHLPGDRDRRKCRSGNRCPRPEQGLRDVRSQRYGTQCCNGEDLAPRAVSSSRHAGHARVAGVREAFRSLGTVCTTPPSCASW